MARPRTFEPEAALNAAMMVFWEKGFSETSYDDLVSATNVSRKGLYTVFGDKEALFLAALKNYCRKMIPEMFGVLQHHDKGCFMANTAADEIITKPEVKAAYDRFLKTMISEFDGAFRRAGIEEAEAHRLAIYYNGVIQSLQLMAHSRTDPDIVHGFMDTALNELRKYAP